MESKTPGHYRKDIYQIIKEMIGRNLTESEHQKLKTEIQGYLIEHGEAIYKGNTPVAPTVHHVICKQCTKVIVAEGYDKFQKTMNKKVDKKATKKLKKHDTRTTTNRSQHGTPQAHSAQGGKGA